MPHSHQIYDSDKHFVIDPITRNITNNSSKITIMQYDHNSERFTFEIPRVIEGHDMSLSDVVRVHFINIGSIKTNTNSGVYEVDDVVVSSDDPDTITFSWLISGASTKHNGSLNFAIRFYCLSDESEIEYSWGTNIYSGINVANSLDNSETIVEDYVDVLEKWKQDTIDIWSDNTNKIIGNLNALETEAKENLVLAINEVKNTTDSKQDTISDLEAIRTGAAKGATALQSVPNTYRTAAAQDVIDNGLSDRVSVIEGKETGWNSKYSKPTDGIPKTDLESAVQTSLGKAETALQEHQSLAAYRTAEAQDIIDDTKQDKLIAGENITIAADGKTISATGGSDIETVESQLVDIPSKLSQLTNDAGYLTLGTLPKYDGSVT